MFQLLRHTVHSSLQTTKSVATFMPLPHWRGLNCNACMSWLNHYPGLVQVLAKFNSRHPNTDSIPYLTLPNLPSLCNTLLSQTHMPERH
eukprot:1157053-Pelagomonas_calceolata.AAC.2